MDYSRQEMKDIAYDANLHYAGHVKAVGDFEEIIKNIEDIASKLPKFEDLTLLLIETEKLHSIRSRLNGFQHSYERTLSLVETVADRADAPPSPGHEAILTEFSRAADLQRDIWRGRFS